MMPGGCAFTPSDHCQIPGSLGGRRQLVSPVCVGPLPPGKTRNPASLCWKGKEESAHTASPPWDKRKSGPWGQETIPHISAHVFHPEAFGRGLDEPRRQARVLGFGTPQEEGTASTVHRPPLLLLGATTRPPWILCPASPRSPFLSLGHASPAHHLTPALHSPSSPHTLSGGCARDGGHRFVPAPQPDLPSSLRWRQEDAQTEESKSVLQDDGENPDRWEDGGCGEEDGKRAIQKAEKMGAVKYVRVCARARVWSLPSRHGQGPRVSVAWSAVPFLGPGHSSEQD